MESTQTIKTPPLVALKNTAMEAARNHEQKVKEIKKLSNYRWRMFWSGAWAGLVTVSVFLVSLVSWGTTLSGWLYARLLNFGCMRILGIKIKVEGMENLPTAPSVILINHQSNLDAYYLGGIFPRHTVVVAKKEMKKVPLFGITLKASRTIFVDREDSSDTKRALKQAIDTIKKDKNHIWIFPEGTRSQGKGLGEFKKGAFAMAIASGAPIVPIINEPMERLLDIPNKTLHKGTQHVKILPAIPTEGMKFRDMDALHDKVRALFEKEIAAF